MGIVPAKCFWRLWKNAGQGSPDSPEGGQAARRMTPSEPLSIMPVLRIYDISGIM